MSFGAYAKKHKMIFLIICIVLIAGIWFWWTNWQPNHKQAQLKIGTSVFDVAIADTALTRTKGLSGHAPLQSKEGMLFIFPSASSYGFWMKDMTFALDFVWIKDNKVIGLTENVPPEPGKNMMQLTVYYPPNPADMVLEINAGMVKNFNIKVSDVVQLNERVQAE